MLFSLRKAAFAAVTVVSSNTHSKRSIFRLFSTSSAMKSSSERIVVEEEEEDIVDEFRDSAARQILDLMRSGQFEKAKSELKACPEMIKSFPSGTHVPISESPIHEAARMGLGEMISTLSQLGGDVNVGTGESNATPLQIASLCDGVVATKALIQAGADVNLRTLDGFTALMIAAEGGFDQVAAILLKHGGSHSDGYALSIAAMQGHDKVVKVLLESDANPNVSPPGLDGVLPLHYAAMAGNEHITELLLKHNARVEMTNGEGWTPLHTATMCNNESIVKMLITQGKADPNAKGSGGIQPLHIAAQEGHEELARTLIALGGDVNGMADGGELPLHYAAIENHESVAKVLIQHGATD